MGSYMKQLLLEALIFIIVIMFIVNVPKIAILTFYAIAIFIIYMGIKLAILIYKITR